MRNEIMMGNPRREARIRSAATWLLLAAVAALTGVAAKCHAAVETDRMLWAIASVETGGNSRAIGHDGERSAWQFTRATWREYTRAPFSHASSDPVLALAVAETHLRRLCADLARRGMPVNPRTIARLWHGSAGEYADRVANLYDRANETMKIQRLKSQKPKLVSRHAWAKHLRLTAKKARQRDERFV